MDLPTLWQRLAGDLGWVDLSALTILALFFLLGLIRGLVWQVGRACAVLGGYGLAVTYGAGLGRELFAVPEPRGPQLYVAYVLVFLLAFFALSLVAKLVQVLVRRAGMGGYDRLGGGALGIVTGSSVVLGLLALVLMFGERFPVHSAVRESHALRLSQQAVAALGDLVPRPLQVAFAVEPPRVASAEPRADRPRELPRR